MSLAVVFKEKLVGALFSGGQAGTNLGSCIALH